MGLVVALELEGRVLFEQAVQRGGELLLVGLGARLDRHGEDRVRPGDGRHHHRLPLGGEGVPGVGAGELRHRGQVPCRDARDLHLLLAAKAEQPVEPLVVRGSGVGEDLVGLHRPGEDLEERDLAHVRVGDRLEDERQGVPSGIRSHLHLLARGLDGDGRPVERRGSDLADQRRQAVDRHRPGSRSADHREHRCVSDALGQGPLQLGAGGDVPFQVALEEVVVGDHYPLDEAVSHGLLLLRHLVGDLRLLALAAVVDEGPVGEEVGDAAEGCLLTYRQLQRGDARPELALEVFEGSLERRSLAVELVDEHHPGDPVPCRVAPVQLRLHLDPVHRTDDEDDQVRHPEGCVNLAGVVGVAGCVDEVELVSVPLHGGQGERQGEALLLLLRLEVACGVAVLDPPHPGEHPRPEEQRLDERGLAGAAVADESDVPDLLRCDLVHCGRNPLVLDLSCAGPVVPGYVSALGWAQSER